MPLIDPELLEILVCPVSHAPLEEDVANSRLICRASGLAYPVREGIPVMLPEEAEHLAAGETAEPAAAEAGPN